MPALLTRRVGSLLRLDLLQHGRQPLVVDDRAGLHCLDLVEHLETEHRSVELNREPPVRVIAESARGVSPRAAHRSGLDTLASSGSCHRTKAAASRRELELLLLPVGSLPTSVTCPLRSTGITPFPRYYGAVRPYPPHRYFRPRSFAASTFSLGIAGQVLKFRTRARTRVMPPIHRAPRGQ